MFLAAVPAVVLAGTGGDGPPAQVLRWMPVAVPVRAMSA
jgi:hypothetical protein